ncbi:sensor histidine kinase NtrY-like [Aliihoeflea sp. PC F10.4]
MTIQTTASDDALMGTANRALEGRRLGLVFGIAGVICALISAAISFAILLGLTPIAPDASNTLVLIAINTGFTVLLLGLIGVEINRIYQARRRGKAASRLHVRIVAMFSLVAAIPAILVAIVASVTLDIGLDRWFELRTRAIVSSSLSIAEAYVQENGRSLQGTTLSMAFDLDQARALYSLDRTGFRQLMTNHVRGRSLAQAALIRPDGSVILQADSPSGVSLPEVPAEWVELASQGEPLLIEPRVRNIVGAIIRLQEIDDAYLFTIRELDPEVIRARQIVRANTEEYRGLEQNRVTTQLAFAILYLGVTLIVVLAAIWTGIAVADRIVRPIRQLIGAADEVATGNLDVSVPVKRTDGDVASLGDTFNKMIQQLKTQRNQLVRARNVMDERRRFSEAVLSGVSAGVIGVDPKGIVAIVNRSTEKMLSLPAKALVGRSLADALPQIAGVFERGREHGRPVYREQVAFARAGAERTFNVQITTEQSSARRGGQSYVVTVDDITDLVQAQRSSAWADVARRIAHEIKNPLTPIQLSAERIRRRYGKVITEDREVFDQCTETIIRQVGDIGRMVDEFSAFARMPKPDMQMVDIREPLREASFLVEVSRSDIKFRREFGSEALMGHFDSRLLAQAFGNIIKNASEAIEQAQIDTGRPGEILVRCARSGTNVVVEVIDNGKGLPTENRQRLLEPYMTTREKGTGLGLAIVKKIVEDHGGTLELLDAPASFHGGVGARVRMIFPLGDKQEVAGQTAPVTEEVTDGV